VPEGTDPVTLPPIAGPWDFDVHTVARGVDECNMHIAQGWRVYHAAIIVHDLVQASTQRGPVRQPVPYYLMGRRLSQEEGVTRAQIMQAAAESSDGALAQVDPAEPDDEPTQGGPELRESEPPALPPRGRGAPRRTGLETTGIR